MSKPQRVKFKKNRNQQANFLLAYIFCAILLFGFYIIFEKISGFKNFNRQSNSSLPVPKISEVYYPQPLAISPLKTTVLGASTIDAYEFIQLINRERINYGSEELRISTLLNEAAKRRAEVILKYQNFSHDDPYENIVLGTVLPSLNYHFVYATENIGLGGNSASDFVYGFMHSSSHRENLLDPKLKETGAAFVTGRMGNYYVNITVQLFAIPGGIDEYLGYSKNDFQAYKQALFNIKNQLNPVDWYLGKILGNREFTDARYTNLKRQQEILTTIYRVMSEEKPLSNDHVAMILEYNQIIGKI